MPALPVNGDPIPASAKDQRFRHETERMREAYLRHPDQQSDAVPWDLPEEWNPEA